VAFPAALSLSLPGRKEERISRRKGRKEGRKKEEEEEEEEEDEEESRVHGDPTNFHL
jgi:ribosomal protein L12E/L44/L45/RPP1/RPP2